MDCHPAPDPFILTPRDMSFNEFLQNFRTISSSEDAQPLPDYSEVAQHVDMSHESMLNDILGA